MPPSSLPPSSSALAVLDVPSDIVLGHKLGSGSFGSVYAGTFQGHPAALKAVPIEATSDGAALSGEIQSEIRLLKQCNTEWIVKYVGCLAKGQMLWIAMEQCDASVSDVRAARLHVRCHPYRPHCAAPTRHV